MILETERLTLAPVVQADAPLIYLMMSDPDVMAHWDVEAIEDPDVVEAFVAAQVREVESGAGWYWSMRLTADGTFVGVCEEYVEVQQHGRYDRVRPNEIEVSLEDGDIVLRADRFYEARFMIGETVNAKLLVAMLKTVAGK